MLLGAMVAAEGATWVHIEINVTSLVSIRSQDVWTEWDFETWWWRLFHSAGTETSVCVRVCAARTCLCPMLVEAMHERYTYTHTFHLWSACPLSVGVCGTSEDCLGYGFKECVELVMQVRRATGRRGGTWEPMASFCRVSSPGGMVPASWPSGEGERVRQTRPCFHRCLRRRCWLLGHWSGGRPATVFWCSKSSGWQRSWAARRNWNCAGRSSVWAVSGWHTNLQSLDRPLLHHAGNYHWKNLGIGDQSTEYTKNKCHTKQRLVWSWRKWPSCRCRCPSWNYPIDEIPLFSNYSPCFHKIGYIQKIVYQKNNYLVKSMIEKSVYFYKIGRFFPGHGGRSLVESRSDFRPLFAGVGRSLVKVWRLIFATPPAFPRIGVVLWSDFGRRLAPNRNYLFPLFPRK